MQILQSSQTKKHEQKCLSWPLQSTYTTVKLTLSTSTVYTKPGNIWLDKQAIKVFCKTKILI